MYRPPLTHTHPQRGMEKVFMEYAVLSFPTGLHWLVLGPAPLLSFSSPSTTPSTFCITTTSQTLYHLTPHSLRCARISFTDGGLAATKSHARAVHATLAARLTETYERYENTPVKIAQDRQFPLLSKGVLYTTPSANTPASRALPSNKVRHPSPPSSL